jgi:hypothetical protein
VESEEEDVLFEPLGRGRSIGANKMCWVEKGSTAAGSRTFMEAEVAEPPARLRRWGGDLASKWASVAACMMTPDEARKEQLIELRSRQLAEREEQDLMYIVIPVKIHFFFEIIVLSTATHMRDGFELYPYL